MPSKIAIVTGHKGGLGSALVTALRNTDYEVVGIDRSAEGVSAAEREIVYDISTLNEESSMKELGLLLEEATQGKPVDLLINNAAHQHLGTLRETKGNELVASFRSNVMGPMCLFQLLVDQLENAKGMIINIGSVHATQSKAEFGAYAISKSAISTLSRTISIEEGTKIRSVEIRPGAISTPMLEAGFEGRPHLRQQLNSIQPTKTIAQPAEIADLCISIAESSSPAINGAIITADCGISGVLTDPIADE